MHTIVVFVVYREDVRRIRPLIMHSFPIFKFNFLLIFLVFTCSRTKSLLASFPLAFAFSRRSRATRSLTIFFWTARAFSRDAWLSDVGGWFNGIVCLFIFIAGLVIMGLVE